MKTDKLSVLLKGGIIVFGICGLLMCVLWYPYTVSLTAENSVEKWIQLIFYWLVSIPCFVILVFAWRITGSIKTDEVFTKKTAKCIKLCMFILFMDVCVFFIGNVVFMILGWSKLAFVNLMLAAIGLVVTSVLLVACHYVEKGANLQEEVEGTI